MKKDQIDDILESQESMEDIGLIMDLFNKEKGLPSDEDIERRLKNFYVANPAGRKPFFRIGIWLGIAAAIVLAFILVNPFAGHQDSVELQLAQNGILASSDGSSYSEGMSKLKVPSSLDGNTHEQEIDSKELGKVFTSTDTIKLNVAKGHTCKVILPDGSCAYLHPDTKMVYPREFDGQERRVRLDGEAYFVVRKDKSHPFIVATANSETLVTGTEFNVCSGSAANPGTRVTLVNGSVQLSNKVNRQKVFLTPGEEATVREGYPISVCETDTMTYVAWRDGYFYFDNTSLYEILQKVSQSYGVQVVFSDSKLGSYRMHFTLRRDQSLKEAVEMLNRMKKVKVSIKGGKLYVEES